MTSPPGFRTGAYAGDVQLETCLRGSRNLGFLGPMPVRQQIEHSLAMAGAVAESPRSVLDLGSGGGVPGLVLARLAWSDARWVLLEASIRRSAFLADALVSLAMADRVGVMNTRAEEAGRRPELRHRFDVVVARSFGPPGVTAECSAPFVREGGLVVVSEPPTGSSSQRWPSAGLHALNLVVEETRATPVHLVVLRSVGPCAERYPRRVGVPSKRPIF